MAGSRHHHPLTILLLLLHALLASPGVSPRENKIHQPGALRPSLGIFSYSNSMSTYLYYVSVRATANGLSVGGETPPKSFVDKYRPRYLVTTYTPKGAHSRNSTGGGCTVSV